MLRTLKQYLIPLLLILVSINAYTQDVLRGEVRIEREPILGGLVDAVYPLDDEAAYRRALEQAASFFAAQIYGWSFHYDIGERARGIAEEFELTPLGDIPWGDPQLFVTHAHFDGTSLSVWLDYRPNPAQRRRLEIWSSGTIRSAQAIGFQPLVAWGEDVQWRTLRENALKDAARSAVRTMLRGSERNRPKQVTGLISLQSFPSFWIDSGRWAVRARFRVEIREIIPFAVY